MLVIVPTIFFKKQFGCFFGTGSTGFSMLWPPLFLVLSRMQERSSDPPLNQGPSSVPQPMSGPIFRGSCPSGDPRPDPAGDPQKGPPEQGGHLRGRPSPGRHARWIFSHPERVRAVLDSKRGFGAPPRALRSNRKRQGPGDRFPVGPGAVGSKSGKESGNW